VTESSFALFTVTPSDFYIYNFKPCMECIYPVVSVLFDNENSSVLFDNENSLNFAYHVLIC